MPGIRGLQYPDEFVVRHFFKRGLHQKTGLMAASDVFVFLDDMQFARRSWQSRNRILTANSELTLTVPVRKHDRDTPISAIEIDDSQAWRDKHLAAIRHAYGKRPGFEEDWAFVSGHAP